VNARSVGGVIAIARAGLRACSDRRLAPSLRRAPVVEIERMLGLYSDIYRGFTVKHFHEQLVKRHNYVLCYTVTKLHLHRAGLVYPAKKRSAHRKKRPRRPMVGMMLHQDASTHAWLPGDPRKYDLVVTMEDATRALYSAFLVDEEGTTSSFQGLREVVDKHSLFCSLYSDRGSHYCVTPEAGGKVSKTMLTQVGRALSQLGIEHIAAYSPQARGSIGAGINTLQDRLPKEFKLAGIATVEAANKWLRDSFIVDHNARFAIQAEQTGSAFVADRTGAWREILCVQEDRTVGQDNTVKWEGAQPATATEPAAPPLCQDDGEDTRLPGRLIGGVLRAASTGRLQREGHTYGAGAAGCVTRFHRGPF
jgi:hypothetical protein